MNLYLQQLTEIASVSKYTKWYANIILNASGRAYIRGIHEKHHILPKCFKLGGEKDLKNLVALTTREHFIVHRLLTKMFTGNMKRRLQFAFWAMCSLFTNGRRDASRHYEAAKRELRTARTGFQHTEEHKQRLSELRRGTNTGVSNHMYGRVGSLHHAYGKPGPMLGRKHTIEAIQKSVNTRAINRAKLLPKQPKEKQPSKWKASDKVYAALDKAREIRWSDQAKQEHSKAMTGSGNNHAHTWQVTNLATGEIEVIDDLKAHCAEHQWNYKSLMAQRGRGKPYKGFVIDILLVQPQSATSV